MAKPRSMSELNLVTNDKILRHSVSRELISLVDLWRQLLNIYGQEIYGGVTSIRTPVKRIIEVKEDVRNEYRVELQDRGGKIEQLTFYATVELIPSDAPLEYCKSYDDRHIVAHWDKGDGSDNFTAILTKKQ